MLRDDKQTTLQGITYVETTPLLEFEQKYNTQITISVSKPKENHSLQTGNIEDMVKISGPFIPHRYATFLLGGKKQKASVNKSIKIEEQGKKNLLSISNCRDSNGNLFWLIHRSNKVTVPSVLPIDIEELNSDLDTLLS